MWVFSPRAGGADLVVEPVGVVMTDIGVIPVVDEATSQRVGIDAVGLPGSATYDVPVSRTASAPF